MKKIRYFLLDNPITPDPDDCRAQVFDYEVITEVELFAHITCKGSGITMPEIRTDYEAIKDGFNYFLERGCGFNTEFLKISPVMLGVRKKSDDSSKQHKIKYRATLGKRHNHAADDVKVEKVAPPSNLPLPATFEDVVSETVNETLTPEETAVLTGIRLKFNQDDPQHGIFLIDSAKNEYQVEKILSPTGAKIVFLTPVALATNEYSLEVRILPKGNKNLKKGMLTENCQYEVMESRLPAIGKPTSHGRKANQPWQEKQPTMMGNRLEVGMEAIRCIRSCTTKTEKSAANRKHELKYCVI
jgi:hypothetical protein